MSWKNILKGEVRYIENMTDDMTEEERKQYMRRLADQSRAFEKYRKELEGTNEAFKPGETFEQHRKRLGY